MTDKKTQKSKNELWSYILVILITVACVFGVKFGLKAAGISPININGESMSPTYHDKTLLFVKETTPTAGNIIVFKADNSWDAAQHKYFIKRIVATPGDKLIIQQDKLYVNDKEQKDLKDYVVDLPDTEITIPKDKYFVMGDNTNNSNDSLFELVKGNSTYLVDKNQIITSGNDKLSFKYWF